MSSVRETIPQPGWLVSFLRALSRGFVNGWPPGTTSEAWIFSQALDIGQSRECYGVVVLVERDSRALNIFPFLEFSLRIFL